MRPEPSASVVVFPKRKPVALVTGASSGIGLALAQRFADQGHDLVIVGSHQRRLDAAASLLRRAASEPHVVSLASDLSDADGIYRVLATQRDEAPIIDVLVCNAGVGVFGDFMRETHLDAEIEMIQLNVMSLVALTKHVGRQMVARASGRILLVASATGLPTPRLAVYGATKDFVFSFARAIREELRGSGVSVTALCPGPTDTGFFARAGMRDATAAGRPLANPARVAQAGYDALMRGDEHVVTSLRDRVRAVIGRIMPWATVTRLGRFD